MTVPTTKHIDDLHFEHQLWISEANFFVDELKVYQNRLAEVAAKNTKEEVRKQIEHFQNQFIIQKEQLDILKHDVNAHEQHLTKYAIEHPHAIERKQFANHIALFEKMEIFKKIYAELKKEFLHFLTVWM